MGMRPPRAIVCPLVPVLVIAASCRGPTPREARQVRAVVSSGESLGAVSVELLDHHGDPLGPAVRRVVDGGLVAFAFAEPAAPVEGVHVHVGSAAWDLTTSPSVHAGADAVAGKRPGLSIVAPAAASPLGLPLPVSAPATD
jgi:hypothetical protein